MNGAIVRRAESVAPPRYARPGHPQGFSRQVGQLRDPRAWLLLAVRHGYEPANEPLERILTAQGRRKNLTSLYKEMVKTEAGKTRALAIYRKVRPMYQSTARRPLDEILGWGSQVSQPR